MQRVKVRVPVYVKRFLLVRYGPPPYNLFCKQSSQLRSEFERVGTGLKANLYSGIRADSSVELILGPDDAVVEWSLMRHFKTHKKLFEAGLFATPLFFSYFYIEVESEIRIMTEYANKNGIRIRQKKQAKEGEMTISIAKSIRNFIERYQLDADTKDFNDLLRLYVNRTKQNNDWIRLSAYPDNQIH